MFGKRFNKGKVRYELVPVNGVKLAAKVFAYGAEKYGEDNWRKGLSWKQTLASLERHLVQLKECEDIDLESNHETLGHLICNALMLAEFMVDEKYKDFDDRLTKTILPCNNENE
jgi:hypothetical protein